MDERGSFVAELIGSSLRALAAGTVVRQTGGPEEVARGLGPGDPGFQALVSETEVRLRYLGEALAAGRPALLGAHLAWAKVAYAARGFAPALLEDNLRCLREELEAELPADAASLAVGVLDGGCEALAAAPAELPSLLEGDPPHAELARRFLLALLEARRRDAVDLVLGAADDGVPVPEIHEHVIAAAQAEMGRLWQQGEVHIVGEHAGSRVVEDALALLRQRIGDPDRDTRGRVLVASTSGERHDIGARMVADRFIADGWDALFLGADTPADGLVQAVRDLTPDLVALSVSLPLHVRASAAQLAALRGALGEAAPPVLVGGAPFAAIPDLWEVVGADAGAADLAGAVAEGRRLLAARRAT